ncbi:VTT domain-containing protein [Lysobacter solisilvae (ex Woo and Kim 2020)]|uniref:VTT domain-containing protein n=1 Tax=Agrilutibacter terrestris TaxID=2865112 RepID=A0A7H0G081_9GAMM|nr:VTT domain-containing protein [Lysobacter terrestris]QNP41697.1 VTT domain-containing protein [Lysobacter terrestris]
MAPRLPRPRLAQFLHHWRRALALLLLCALVALLLSVDALFAALHQLLAQAAPYIGAHPLAGRVVFVALSGLSAMLAFFSSAVLVPMAVYSWGRAGTALLLWLGWLLGGACAYATGRYLGRPMVRGLVPARLADFYLRRLPAQVDFPTALLFQVAMPSELPGYLFGLLRVPFRLYLAVLALVEAPFAAGTVLLGESLIRRQGGWMLVLAVLGLGTSLLAVHRLHRRLRAGGGEED